MDIWQSLKEFDYYEDPDTIEWNFKRKWPEEVKKAIGDGNRGKVHTAEQNRQHSEKMKEQYRNGRVVWNKGIKGAGKGQGVKSCVYRGKTFSSMTEAANHYNVSISAVSQAVKKGT